MAISYLGSSSVKMFPSAYRGQNKDPEAYFTTEGNLTKSDVLGFASKSFVDEYDGTNITIVIKGYRFDTTKSAIQALAASGDSEIYADIKTDNKGTDGTFRTLVCYDDVASTILDDANNKFKGLAFASTKAQLSNDALLVLKLVDNTWGVPSASKLNVSSSQIRTSDSGDDLNKSLSEKVSTKDVVASSSITSPTITSSGSISTGTLSVTSNETVGGNSTITGNLNVGGTTTSTGNLSTSGTTTSTGKITGNNGLEITSGETKLKTTSTGALTSSQVSVNGRIFASGQIYTTNNLEVVGTTLSRDKITGSNGLEISNGDTSLKNTSVTGTLSASGVTSISDDTQSTSTSTGALKVSGGVGVAKNLNVGGALAVTGESTLQNVVHCKSDLQVEKDKQGGGYDTQFKVDNATGNTNIAGTLTVEGNSTFKNPMYLNNITNGQSLVLSSLGNVAGADLSSSYTRTTDAGDDVKVLSGLTQNVVGKITSTSETSLPLASNTQAGLVSTGNQTIKGIKSLTSHFAICTTDYGVQSKEIQIDGFPRPTPIGTHLFVLFTHQSGPTIPHLVINGPTQYAEEIRSNLTGDMAMWGDNSVVELVYMQVNSNPDIYCWLAVGNNMIRSCWFATNAETATTAQKLSCFQNPTMDIWGSTFYWDSNLYKYNDITLTPSGFYPDGGFISMRIENDGDYFNVGLVTLPDKKASQSWDEDVYFIGPSGYVYKLTLHRGANLTTVTGKLRQMQWNASGNFYSEMSSQVNVGSVTLKYKLFK